MTKYYAGIGSRETPEHILIIMSHCAAYLASQNWTLRSGAAIGADSAFEDGVNKIDNGAKEIYLPWRNYNHNNSELNPYKYPFTQEEINFSSRFHPAWHKCSPSAKLLHTRNTRILLGTEAIHGDKVKAVSFIVCWTKHGLVTGGTGQALRIANALNIPIINFGSAQNEKQLEALVLKVDEIQGGFT